jgi:hypothetical protein
MRSTVDAWSGVRDGASDRGQRLDVAARNNLEQLLAKNQTLATVYQFRERLQEIWDRKAPSQEALLHALQDWCHQAEATGIRHWRSSRQSAGLR